MMTAQQELAPDVHEQIMSLTAEGDALAAGARYEDAIKVPTLMDRAPRWASIVLMRALNDAETQTELVRQLQDASPSVKAAIREMCGRIDAVSPTFLVTTVPAPATSATCWSRPSLPRHCPPADRRR